MIGGRMSKSSAKNVLSLFEVEPVCPMRHEGLRRASFRNRTLTLTISNLDLIHMLPIACLMGMHHIDPHSIP